MQTTPDALSTPPDLPSALEVTQHVWHWQPTTTVEHTPLAIRYQQAGRQGKALLLIHGFGASSDHWRKNLPALATEHRVYAIDLLGFGYSAKPQPGQPLPYTFETWSQQIIDFCKSVIQTPVTLVGNSIGCVAALQAAVDAPDWVESAALLDCSLRLLHDRKRLTLPWYRRWSAPILQSVLAYRPLGQVFFQRLARPAVVRKVLLEAYGVKAAVTPELLDLLLGPAKEPGAVDVFLAFIRYSQGPLPEDLLPQVTCPVLLLWGEADPWEPIAMGRELAQFPAVRQFVPLPGIGHCPQDEAPEVVNPLLLEWCRNTVNQPIEQV